MKRIHLAILFFIVFLSPYLILFAQNPEFKVELSKSKYLTYEPVWVKLILINNTDETVIVSKYLRAPTSLIKWKLYSADGNELKYQWMKPVKVTPSYPLAPGDSIYAYFDLLNAFGEKDPPISPRCYLEKGTYYLSVIYEHYGIPIEVKPITFIVEFPSDEEVEAFALFHKAYKAWLIRDYKKAKELFENFIITYPNSIYLEFVYNSLCFVYKWGTHDYQKVLNLSENFIHNRPQSPFIDNMLSHLINAYEGLNRADELKVRLEALASQYRDINPLLSRKALERIQELKL